MESPMTLVAQAISESLFAPYGRLVERPRGPERASLDELIERRDAADVPLKALLTMRPPLSLPLRAARMERHRRSVQLFVPISAASYLAVVATGEQGPDPATLCAFIVPGDLGIAYGIDTWHLPMATLDEPGTFIVLMAMTGDPARDEEWFDLPEPLVVAA
jgi:ureidoglycolate lyase